MEALGITVGDLAVIGILVIAALMGLALGLVKAILFVACWIGAALTAFYSFERVKPYFYQFIDKQMYADFAAAATVFLVSLIVLFWFGSRIWMAVRNSAFNGLDRSLGLLGGLLVGTLVICLAYLGATWMWTEKELPPVIAEARAKPYVRVGANWLRTFIPQAAQQEAESTANQAQERTKQAIETQRAWQKLMGSPSAEGGASSPEAQKGYAPSSRRDMDRLFESKQ